MGVATVIAEGRRGRLILLCIEQAFFPVENTRTVPLSGKDPGVSALICSVTMTGNET